MPADRAPAPGHDGADVVVVGVDGSETSLRAAAWALGLARRQHSRLIVVHVERSGALAYLAPGSFGALTQAKHDVEADLRARLANVVDSFGVDVRFDVRQGDPLQELVAVADDARADLVVVGASASAGHRVLGSVAVRLVRTGHWPVTVVP